ncbi:MAG: isoprenylcysteine carboxylmethyltransferase family protein [Chloroflexi bacterium]|nr:isoprenylcysteine carboxylmethyltransferase family protein [Chloroflexota bacterium]
MNLPPWFSASILGIIFFISLYIWFVVELLNTFIFGRPQRDRRRSDRGSYWMILLMIYANNSLIFILRGVGLGILPASFQIAGIALIWAGIFLREWSIFLLGPSFSIVVQVKSNQKLITTGPYRWMRHPSYTGSILTLAGIGLGVGTWVGAVLAIAIAIVGYSYRVRVEERVMLEAFGQEYLEYMHHTGRFVPWI